MNNVYGVYGMSGFGREVMPMLCQLLQHQSVNPNQIVFIDDNIDHNPKNPTHNGQLNGHRALNYRQFMALKADARHVCIAIASGTVRQRLAQQLEQDGCDILSLISPHAVTMEANTLGPGLLVCAFVTITSNIRIGSHFQANIYSYVGHDCVIGDYVTLGPAVKCNGNVVIEDYSYIGAGAVLKQGSPGKPLKIGKGAVVGMGAVVTKDVPAGATVVGNPARRL